jgi:hypothetical protein
MLAGCGGEHLAWRRQRARRSERSTPSEPVGGIFHGALNLLKMPCPDDTSFLAFNPGDTRMCLPGEHAP